MGNTMKTTLLGSASAAAIALMMGASPAAAVSFSCPVADDVDTTPPTIVECTVPVGLSGTITDLNVSLQIEGESSNSFIHDFQIILSHGGTSVTLYSDGDDEEGVMDAVFDDEAAGPAPVDGDVIGTFQPDGPGSLSDFDGLDFAGLWELSLEDIAGWAGDGDDLLRFELIAETAEDVPEPTTLALLGAGGLAAGATALRRRRKATAAK